MIKYYEKNILRKAYSLVIATFQIKDFFGLTIESFSGSYIDKIIILFNFIQLLFSEYRSETSL